MKPYQICVATNDPIIRVYDRRKLSIGRVGLSCPVAKLQYVLHSTARRRVRGSFVRLRYGTQLETSRQAYSQFPSSPNELQPLASKLLACKTLLACKHWYAADEST